MKTTYYPAINNAHVILFYRLLCLQAEQLHRPLAQLHWYTMAKIEEDCGWSPD